MRAALFSCSGLGDGIVFLTLSYNLFLNGYEVDTYHDALVEMQRFFKNLSIKRYPEISEIDQILNKYDKIFVSYDMKNPFIKKLIEKGKKDKLEDVFVLNPSPSKKIGYQPFYEDTYFSPNRSVVDNILIFCKDILKFKTIKKSNGILCPYPIEKNKYENRVIIHPSSAKDSKNWPLHRYVKLAKFLKEIGYDPVFVVSSNERPLFRLIEDLGFTLMSFKNLNELASYVYESSYMIGNDSGIGHLASSFNIPTVSVFRNFRSAKLWRPGFTDNGKIIFPNKLIPNPFFYRLRDKKWKNFISEKKVLKVFLEQRKS